MDKKLYKIESMEASGPSVREVEAEKAVSILNGELANGRVIFMDGKPLKLSSDEVVTEETLKPYIGEITIINKLTGG